MDSFLPSHFCVRTATTAIMPCRLYTSPKEAVNEFSSAGFSLWGFVLSRPNPRRLKPALLKSIERLNLGDLALMNFRNPHGNRRRGVVHIDVPNVRIHRWQHVFRKFARPGIESQD